MKAFTSAIISLIAGILGFLAGLVCGLGQYALLVSVCAVQISTTACIIYTINKRSSDSQ